MTDAFLADIEAQAETVRAELSQQRDNARRALDGLPVQRVGLVGSGDCLFAARAVERLYAETLPHPVRALTSLDAAHYVQWRPGDIAVVMSVSGESSRVVEAATKARAGGATTIAVTSRTGSALADATDRCTTMAQPLNRELPHARDYTVTLLALGALLEAMAADSAPELDRWADAVETTLDSAADVVRGLGAASGATWFLGAGPDLATAHYGALKYWEASGMPAWPDEIEEFGHGAIVQARPGDRAVLISAGLGAETIARAVSALDAIGVEPLTIGPESPPHGASGIVTTLLGTTAWSPFTSCLPIQSLTHAEVSARGLDASKPFGSHPAASTYELAHISWTRGHRLDGPRKAEARP
ncbi:MAG TPA: SIS domain-containing protein [Nocardioidaceae bacterium]|nr:SIS domain-containing protein [Nocardioidaceae bacterium]